MQVAQFKSQLSDGGARPNQFRVNLQFPGTVGHPGQDYDLLVTGAAIPASTVNPVITQFRGREVKFAGERIFDPWTITVINDSKFGLRAQFEKWMEEINNKENNSGEVAWENYQVDMSVEHLDRNNVALQSYTLVQAFPINMSEIALQYAQNDIIEEFTVTFQYQHYLV